MTICTQVFVWIYVLNSLESRMACHMVTLCYCLNNCQTIFPKWLYYFTFPLAICEGSYLFTSLPPVVIVCPLDRCHPNRYKCCILKFWFVFPYRLVGLPLWLNWWRICLQCRRHGIDPWVGKIPYEGKGYPLQYSGLENSVDCIVHGLQRVRQDWATFTFTFGLPWWLDGKASIYNAGDLGSIPGSGRIPWEGNGNPL